MKKLILASIAVMATIANAQVGFYVYDGEEERIHPDFLELYVHYDFSWLVCKYSDRDVDQFINYANENNIRMFWSNQDCDYFDPDVEYTPDMVEWQSPYTEH